MTNSTATRTRTTLANLVAASLAANIKTITEADAAIEAAKERKAKAIEAINRTHGRGKHVVAGFGEVTVSANNTYDTKVMLAALRPGQFRLVSERKLVPAQVAQKYPHIYQSAKVERGVKASAKVY